jgi:hypothetical protein
MITDCAFTYPIILNRKRNYYTIVTFITTRLMIDRRESAAKRTELTLEATIALRTWRHLTLTSWENCKIGYRNYLAVKLNQVDLYKTHQ